MSKLGGYALGAGAALSIVSGLLSMFGLDKAAKNISAIGGAIMLIGAALSALGPIVTLLGKKFANAGKKA